LIRNYLITAFRNIRKHKTFSLFNIASLAAGLSIFILATLYGAFNRSFDTFHKNADRIQNLVQVKRTGNAGRQNSAVLPAALPLELKREFPEVEQAVRFSRSRVVLKRGAQKFNESRFFFVDPGFLTVFDFGAVRGHPETALSEVNTVVLTEDSALKYFGKEDPVGKLLTLNTKVDLKITSVVKNPPPNTSLGFDFLASFETARPLQDWMDGRFTDGAGAFVVLAEGAEAKDLTAKLPAFIKKYYQGAPDAPERLFLLPLTEFRRNAESLNLRTHLDWGKPYSIVFFFYLIAAAALIMVCINFMNLSTAYHMVRAKEVGMRKVVGASRAELIRQFLGESVLMAFIALPLAVIIYQFLAEAFISFIDYDIDLALTSHPSVLPVMLGVTFLVGILAGSYPAFFLSSFKPASVLKRQQPSGGKGAAARKILVVAQFVLSIVLIVFTSATRNQLGYLHQMDFGFEWQDVLAIPISGSARANLQSFQDRLVRNPRIISVSGSRYRPVNAPGLALDVIPEGHVERDKWTMKGYAVDYGFIEMLGIRMASGRSFSRDHADADGLIINETAARQLKWEDPVGKRLSVAGKKGVVIGVARNFVFNDVHFKPEPALLYLSPDELQYLLVKTSPGASNDTGVQAFIKAEWDSLVPDLPFESLSLDFQFEDHYKYIGQMSTTVGLVGAFSLLVASMGLLGLTSYAVSRRTKEIGVRKALGASISSIFKLLFSEFMRLIAAANIIAWPLAYFLIDGFMRWAFSYRAVTGVGLFAAASLLTVLASVAAISYHTLKAARTNPQEALRNE